MKTQNLTLLLLSTIGLFFSCNRLDTIEYAPKLAPLEFLNSQHHWKLSFGSNSFVLSQPFSSLIVYFVSLYTIFVGWQSLKKQTNQKALLWWGIGLLLTGIGALFAGTSYQAFGYEIKCSGREFCTWTSWWEILYEIFSGPGMNAFLIAIAFSTTVGRLKNGLILYASANSIIYVIAVLVGAFTPIQFLVSFEFLMLVSTPTIFIILLLTYSASKKESGKMNRTILNSWLLFLLVIVAYIGYLAAGITATLWKSGIWFTENDVLHVGMIFWMWFIHVRVLPIVAKESIA